MTTNDVIVHNNITNQHHVRRCSIQPISKSFQSNVNKQININYILNNFSSKAQSTELKSKEEKEELEQHNQRQLNIVDQEMVKERKKYIRSLSLANDEQIEPEFLRRHRMFSRHDIKNSLIDEAIREY